MQWCVMWCVEIEGIGRGVKSEWVRRGVKKRQET